MRRTSKLLLLLVAVILVGALYLSTEPMRAASDTVLLSGTVKTAAGKPLDGAMISLKLDGGSITTSVFADGQGNYYFPKMQGGKYHAWAQAIGYQTGSANVDLTSAAPRQNFSLGDLKDFSIQLSGGSYVEALPLDTPQHRRMRDVYVHDCTTCHTAAYALQNRFDEDGWATVIGVMSRINPQGSVRPSNTPADPRIDHYKPELAAYLAEMRGPGPSPMQFKAPPRPTGDAALPVVYEYDVPLEETGQYYINDGKDWSFGVPSNSMGVRGIHDATVDLNGNLWFTYLVPSKTRTYGEIDGKTGKVTNFTVPGEKEMVSNTHGVIRAPDGSMWINIFPDSVGHIDVETGKIKVYTTPKGYASIGGHVDWDPKGYIWAATSKGAVRLDPKTGEFKEFPSVSKNAQMYGVAADRDGNGWWAEINLDKVGHSDIATGESLEFNVPANSYVSEGALTDDDKKFYDASAIERFDAASSAPWAQLPRRLSADKNSDDVWVGLYAGENILRINTHTLQYKIYHLPAGDLGAYMPVIDNSHNVWVDVQGSDAIEKFDPKTEKWTHYLWPTRGAAARNITLLDQDGKVQIVCAYWGTGSVGRMVMRSQKEVQALKSEAQRLMAKN